ncbi:hypothetical protein Daus18300_004648 [Diaporthe australafricana]|uniref:Integral membrane protein n=1 Tax=Diaporthe australafricana TaxID=127596 RepID=A0ABR3X7M5_9PEZI
MSRAVRLATVAMLLCAMVVPFLPLLNDVAYFDSAITLARELCRRIKFDQSTILRASTFATEQLKTFHHAAEPLITPYISVCRRIVTETIAQSSILRSVDRYMLPQPSYENLTFHAEHGACVWTVSSTGLPVDFSLHVGTVFLLLATNACSILFSIFIISAIFVPMRIAWQTIKAVASSVAEPKATCGSILEKLVPALLGIAEVLVTIIAFCVTVLVFAVSNIAMFAASSFNVGFEVAKPAPRVPGVKLAPCVSKKFPDLLIAELRDQKRRLEVQLKEKNDLLHQVGMDYARERGDLLDQNEILESANKRQKDALREMRKQHWAIDLTRSVSEQVNDLLQKIKDLQGNLERTVEKRDKREKDLFQQIADRDEIIRSQNLSLKVLRKERDELVKSNDALKAELEKREKLVRSQEKSLNSLQLQINERDEVFKKQLKELEQREEFFRSLKEAMGILQAHIKEQEDLFRSQKRSLEASFKSKVAFLKRHFARGRKQLLAACTANFEARKAAEEESELLKMQLAAISSRRCRQRRPRRCKCKDDFIFHDLADQLSGWSLRGDKKDQVEEAEPEEEFDPLDPLGLYKWKRDRIERGIDPPPKASPPSTGEPDHEGGRHILPLPRSKVDKAAEPSTGPEPVDRSTFKFDPTSFGNFDLPTPVGQCSCSCNSFASTAWSAAGWLFLEPYSGVFLHH